MTVADHYRIDSALPGWPHVAMAKENRQALSRVKKCQECQDVKKQE